MVITPYQSTSFYSPMVYREQPLTPTALPPMPPAPVWVDEAQPGPDAASRQGSDLQVPPAAATPAIEASTELNPEVETTDGANFGDPPSGEEVSDPAEEEESEPAISTTPNRRGRGFFRRWR